MTVEVKDERITWGRQAPAHSSARKFLAAAIEGGWEVKAEQVIRGIQRWVEITVAWPGEAPDTRWSEVVAQFDPISGAFWGATVRVMRRGKEVGGVRDPKISNLINGLNHGPKWYAEQAAEQAARAAELAAAEKERRAALAEAAKIDAVSGLVLTTKRNRNTAVRELRNNLESVIARATDALKNLDQGFAPRPMGGVLGQSAAEADRLVGKVVELVEMTAHLEHLFGPADSSQVWDKWLDHRERAAADKDSTTERQP